MVEAAGFPARCPSVTQNRRSSGHAACVSSNLPTVWRRSFGESQIDKEKFVLSGHTTPTTAADVAAAQMDRTHEDRLSDAIRDLDKEVKKYKTSFAKCEAQWNVMTA
jgi:hypothetical protein